MVKVKVVVADLEIRIMDSNSQMTHIILDSNCHTQAVEEASLKVERDKEDLALGIDNNQEKILETVNIMTNETTGLENAERSKATQRMRDYNKTIMHPHASSPKKDTSIYLLCSI